MKNFWNVVVFLAKVLSLAAASFAGASLSGCRIIAPIIPIID